jgi:hypothetical protein
LFSSSLLEELAILCPWRAIDFSLCIYKNLRKKKTISIFFVKIWKHLPYMGNYLKFLILQIDSIRATN